MKKVAVIFGGVSCEHDISILTGLQVMRALEDKVDIVPIYINKDGEWLFDNKLKDIKFYQKGFNSCKKIILSNCDNWIFKKTVLGLHKMFKIDIAILALHGKNGEDGKIASLLEISKIPYVNTTISGSAIGCDKVLFKSFVNALKIPNIKGLDVSSENFRNDKSCLVKRVVKKLGLPVILKPARLGSSIGICICYNEEDLIDKVKYCLRFDNKVLIEKYLHNFREINVAIYKRENNLIVSELEEVKKSEDLLSFNDKYNSKNIDVKRIIPADINEKQKQDIIQYAKKVYKNLDLFGVCRFDFLLDDGGNVYINEVNTIPGSYANYLFKPKNIDFTALLEELMKDAVMRFEKEKSLTSTFQSGILDNFNGNKIKK